MHFCGNGVAFAAGLGGRSPDTSILELIQRLQSRHEERIQNLLETHRKQLQEIMGAGSEKTAPPVGTELPNSVPSSQLDSKAGIEDGVHGKVKRSLSVASNTDAQRRDLSIEQKIMQAEKDVLVVSKEQSGRHSYSRRAALITRSPKFELFCGVFIGLNALMIGVEADWTVKNPGEDLPTPFEIIDYGFTLIFTLELILRIIAEGRSFLSLSNPNFSWNIFDSFIVLLSILSDALGLLDVWAANISVTRLMRIMRLTRAVRLVRVLRFCKDLRVMILGIMSSLPSLLWASLLLMVVIFMYGVLTLQVAGDELSERIRQGKDITDPHFEAIISYYGGMFLTLYTLFGSISGGLSWIDAARPLVEIHPALGFTNALYVMFVMFCVLNVITGVFVENAFKMNNEDEDRVIMDRIKMQKHWITEVKNLFKKADRQSDGFLDLKEFEDMLQDVRVQHCLSKLGLDADDVNSAHSLFSLFDFAENGKVSLDDFAEGIQRVRGTARSIDIVWLMHNNRALMTEVSQITKSLESLQKQQQLDL